MRAGDSWGGLSTIAHSRVLRSFTIGGIWVWGGQDLQGVGEGARCGTGGLCVGNGNHSAAEPRGRMNGAPETHVQLIYAKRAIISQDVLN